MTDLKNTLKEALAARAQITESDLTKSYPVARPSRAAPIAIAAAVAVVGVAGGVIALNAGGGSTDAAAPVPSVPTMTATTTDSVALLNSGNTSVSPVSDPADEGALVDQAPLVGYLDRIGELIKAKGLTGYVDAALHVPERSVTISWKGTPPAELTPLVAEAASQGITITFVAAPYSDAELQSALEEISGPLADMANLRLEGHAIDMIGLAEGHTGLAIAGPLASTNPETQAQIRAIAREAIGDIPIFFVAQPPKMDTDDLKSGNGS